MDSLSKKLSECHVFILPAQGDIYCMCRLPSGNKTSPTRILAASLKRPLYLLEFTSTARKPLTPRCTELTFTYIQGQAEIVSIDALMKPTSSHILIAVTYIKSIGGDSGKFLNIYTLRETGPEISMDGLTFSCSLELGFIPYQLFHGSINDKCYFFLTGSDHKIRAYREDASHVIKECSVSKTFPEFFRDFPSIVLQTTFHYTENGLRLTAIGCECGTIFLFVVKIKGSVVLNEYYLDMGCSVTSLKFCSLNGSIHLLATFSVFPAVIYSNVIERGFEDHQVLHGSDEFDVVTCSLVCDFHMDRKPTVLLGTYGQELLVYRFADSKWSLEWQKSFSHPILSLDYCDTTGDGVRELVAMTSRGVHIFQHDLTEVAQLLVSRLKAKNKA